MTRAVLLHIQIRDFAIIDAAELELASGLTVLTGETGAGKSILVDALLLAAGGRAGAEVVRHGADRAEVSATFAISNNAAARAWLAEKGFDRAFGARPMARLVERTIKKPLSELLLFGNIEAGSTVLVTRKDDGLALDPQPTA